MDMCISLYSRTMSSFQIFSYLSGKRPGSAREGLTQSMVLKTPVASIRRRFCCNLQMVTYRYLGLRITLLKLINVCSFLIILNVCSFMISFHVYSFLTILRVCSFLEILHVCSFLTIFNVCSYFTILHVCSF